MLACTFASCLVIEKLLSSWEIEEYFVSLQWCGWLASKNTKRVLSDSSSSWQNQDAFNIKPSEEQLEMDIFGETSKEDSETAEMHRNTGNNQNHDNCNKDRNERINNSNNNLLSSSSSSSAIEHGAGSINGPPPSALAISHTPYQPSPTLANNIGRNLQPRANYNPGNRNRNNNNTIRNRYNDDPLGLRAFPKKTTGNSNNIANHSNSNNYFNNYNYNNSNTNSYNEGSIGGGVGGGSSIINGTNTEDYTDSNYNSNINNRYNNNNNNAIINNNDLDDEDDDEEDDDEDYFSDDVEGLGPWSDLFGSTFVDIGASENAQANNISNNNNLSSSSSPSPSKFTSSNHRHHSTSHHHHQQQQQQQQHNHHHHHHPQQQHNQHNQGSSSQNNNNSSSSNNNNNNNNKNVIDRI